MSVSLPSLSSICLSLASVALASSQTFALSQLQFDFQTQFSTNSDVTNSTLAIAVRSGASDVAQGMGNAAIDTGAAVGTGVVDAVANGYMSLDGTTDTFLQTQNVAGGNGEYQNYTTSTLSAIAASTVYVVFRPGVTSNAGSIFSSANSSSTGRTTMRITSTDFRMEFGRQSSGDPGTGNNNASIATIDFASWNTDSWYFLAASWQTGETTSVYLRELKNGSGVIDPGLAIFALADRAEGAESVPPYSSGTISHLVNIGAGTNSTAVPNNFVTGDMAYFNWTDSYIDNASAYEAIYSSLIPEPSEYAVFASTLALLGAITYRRRR